VYRPAGEMIRGEIAPDDQLIKVKAEASIKGHFQFLR
jgi:hypothetical protein